MSETNNHARDDLVSRLVHILDGMAAGELQMPSQHQRALPIPLRHSLDQVVRAFHQRIAAASPPEARDELTGLLTATPFHSRVRECLARKPWLSAMMVIGLSGLRRICDAHGHLSGEQLLALASSRITTTLDTIHLKRGGVPPIVCRLSADEFAAFLEIDERADAERYANDILHALREPYFISRDVMLAGANVGVAIAPEHGRHTGHLLRRAELALQVAQASAPHAVAIFDDAMGEIARETATQEAMLRQALVENQFELYFQPLVRTALSQHRPNKVEALIRWHHPEQGLLLPGAFMPLVAASDLTGEIGRWVISTAFQTAARWQEAGHAYRMAVNVSPLELLQGDIVAHACEWLARTGARADLIEIEITESSTMDEDILLDRLNQLHELGFGLSIDDFGTGYSNLARLSRLPFDSLKIDRSLVEAASQRAEEPEVLACIIRLGKALGCEIVVEGIETSEQAALFTDLGCQMLQGFHFSHALPESEALAWLQQADAASQISKAA